MGKKPETLTAEKHLIIQALARGISSGYDHETLVGLALQRVSAMTRPNDGVNAADVLIEMLRIRRTRELVQLVIAMDPKRANDASTLISDGAASSDAEVAFVFGVSEGTVTADWMSAGVPYAKHSPVR